MVSQRSVKVLNQMTQFLLFFGFAALAVGCGKKPLNVRLLPPAGEPTELLWWGVEQRLLFTPKGDSFPYQEGSKVDIQAEEGDSLRFEGRDGDETVWISGECKITSENECTIPLYRRLK
jgi:hypothetical protein